MIQSEVGAGFSAVVKIGEYSTALTPNCLRHFNPKEKNEVRQTHKEITFREKKKKGIKVDSTKTSPPAKSKWEPGNAETLSKKIH